MQKRFYFAALLSMTLSIPAFARQVEDSEYLNALRRATGGSVSNDSYQNRLDSILSPDAEPERTSVAARENNALQQQMAAQEALDAEVFISTGMPVQEKAKAEDPLKKDENKVPGLEKMEADRINASEREFQKTRQELMEEMETKRRKSLEDRPAIKAPEETVPESGLRPSLANNPFYFQPLSDKEMFEESKPVILNRLINEEGYPEERAHEMVASATSVEEVILKLMKEEDYTYGDALRVSST